MMGGNLLRICICNTCLVVYNPVQELGLVGHKRSNNQSHRQQEVISACCWYVPFQVLCFLPEGCWFERTAVGDVEFVEYASGV